MDDGSDRSTVAVPSEDETSIEIGFKPEGPDKFSESFSVQTTHSAVVANPSLASVCEASHVTPSARAFSARRNNEVLLMFFRSSSSAHSLKFYLESVGFKVSSYDIVDGPQCDLSDDAVWGPLYNRLQCGKFIAAFIAPPCGTFSRLRMLPGGPPQLRAVEGKHRYGLPGLTVKRAETVRLHNLLALRASKAFQAMIGTQGVVALEQPALRDQEVSMLRLDEFQNIMKQEGVKHVVKAQCAFGCSSEKLSSWMTFQMDFSDMQDACSHQPTSWYAEVSVEELISKHPPSRGTMRYFRTKAEAQEARPSGQTSFVSSELAFYPALLNKYHALKVKLAAARMTSCLPPQAPPVHDWADRTGKENVQFSEHLKGPAAVVLACFP